MLRFLIVLFSVALSATISLHSPAAYGFSTAFPVTCTTTVAPASLQAAVNSASPGQVICATAGSASFSVDIPGGKDIVVAGAAAWGGGTTIQTGGGITQHNVGSAVAGSRVTGFTITSSQIPLGYISGVSGFRYDHLIITRATWTETYTVIGSQDANDPLGITYSRYKPSGVFDHITCTNCRLVATGEWSNQGGRVRWSDPEVFGDGNCFYIEDSTFVVTDLAGGIHNAADGNVGGCYVFRFNSGTNTYVEMHSVQGGSTRGMRRWEVYQNAMAVTAPSLGFSPPTRTRGGSGLIFNNYYIDGPGNAWSERSILLDNVRTYDSTRWDGFCGNGAGGDGTAPIDGNQPGKAGYPCRDQVGTGQDAFLWPADSSANYIESPISNIPSQAHVSAYFFGNKIGAGPAPSTEFGAALMDPSNLSYQKQFVMNRDWYQNLGSACSGASCTTGVGIGTLANRPAACTTGVGYWATDQGSWNTSASNPVGRQANGANGVLYKCTATNTWTIYYTPYTYPHPLQTRSGGSDTTPPSPPTNLSVH